MKTGSPPSITAPPPAGPWPVALVAGASARSAPRRAAQTRGRSSSTPAGPAWPWRPSCRRELVVVVASYVSPVVDDPLEPYGRRGAASRNGREIRILFLDREQDSKGRPSSAAATGIPRRCPASTSLHCHDVASLFAAPDGSPASSPRRPAAQDAPGSQTGPPIDPDYLREIAP
jgi:hypothetical protein